MKKLLLVLPITLTGCATTLNVLGDRRTAAACQVADGATTYYALTHGAVESNSILAGLGAPGILAFKLIMAFVIYKLLPPPDKATKGDKVLTAGVTLFGCVPAVNNIRVIGQLK